jgi:hypothetical protein
MHKHGGGEATTKNTNMVSTRIFKVWIAVATYDILSLRCEQQ